MFVALMIAVGYNVLPQHTALIHWLESTHNRRLYYESMYLYLQQYCFKKMKLFIFSYKKCHTCHLCFWDTDWIFPLQTVSTLIFLRIKYYVAIYDFQELKKWWLLFTRAMQCSQQHWYLGNRDHWKNLRTSTPTKDFNYTLYLDSVMSSIPSTN